MKTFNIGNKVKANNPKITKVSARLKDNKKSLITSKKIISSKINTHSKISTNINLRLVKSKSILEKETFMNSESTDQKSGSTKIEKYEKFSIYNKIFLKEEFLQFNDSNNSNSQKFEKSQFSGSLKSEKSQNIPNKEFYQKQESRTSNFLNIKLGEDESLTNILDQEQDTMLRCSKNTFKDIRQMVESDLNHSIQSKDSSKINDLSLSKITNRKISVENQKNKKLSGFILGRNISSRISPKFSNNISILSSENLTIFEGINYDYGGYELNCQESDYSDTDEGGRVNEIYNMKTHDNNLNSHLDILKLNFLLRYLFHKSCVFSEKTNENKSYIKFMHKMFTDLLLPVENKKNIYKKIISSGYVNSLNPYKLSKGTQEEKNDKEVFKKIYNDKRISIYRSISNRIRHLSKYGNSLKVSKGKKLIK